VPIIALKKYTDISRGFKGTPLPGQKRERIIQGRIFLILRNIFSHGMVV
jgi:hypothetical protein